MPAVFGSLAKHNIIGKLPTIAGWQPALPRQDCFGETPKVRGGRAAHATRMRYPGVHVARPATFASIYHLPIPENRKRKLRHCFRQSQLRILDAKFAIAENIAQTSQLG